MPRYRFTIEYDGGPFVGWQRQALGRSVQGVVEAAITAMTGEAAPLHGAGRTDAGVHATGQVAHVDLARPWPPDTLRDGINAHLRPAPVAILAATEAAPEFDARRSAIRRRYDYRILNRRAPAALMAGRVWQIRPPLDAAAMAAAARPLLGQHDFTTFRDSECQAKSPVRTLERLDVVRDGELVTVTAVARSFLHSQVRSMVGTLAKAGTGSWPVARVAEALEARDRKACGPLAPPEGLYLTAVEYPEPVPPPPFVPAQAGTQ